MSFHYNEYNHHYDSPAIHLKTYTAGEDQSRLAAVAKELGLQKQRKPRKQVRAPKRTQNALSRALTRIVQDPTLMDARMRAIYTTSALEEDDDLLGRQMLLRRLQASWARDDFDLAMLEQIEEEEVDAHAAGLGGDLNSAVLGIFKGMVGPAILYLPHGFAGAGWALALPIMLGATAMYLYSSQCLLQAWKHESTKWETQLQPLGGGTNRRSILSYPELANRALGPHGEWLVKIGIALMQSGVCLTYLIFVPQNLHTSMLILFGWNVSAQWWLVAMIVIQIPLSWIRDIRKLTITNFMATILILFGLSLCLGFAFDEASSSTTLDVGPFQSMWDRLTKLHPFGSTWFLFIGTSVLLFEGSITLLVPLQEAVHSEEERKRFPVVYQRVILWIIGFYAFFGTVNWMAFGDNVNVVLTTSLPSNVLATTVQLAYSVAVIFTFPLQNFPALEIACQSISNHLGLQKELRNLISSILVILLALVAVATMDSLDKVVSLMGSLLGCPIAFCFPPWIHSNLCCPTGTRWWGNRLVLGLGLIAMILASVTTIMVW